jgi:hypothetical protein
MSSGYIHGYTDEEAERLLAQAQFLAPLVFDGLDLSDVGTLLEVGVGVGAETQVLLERWPRLRVLGVDVSQRSLARARHTLAGRLDRVQLVHGSGSRLPLADRSVDAALFVWVLEHVPDPLSVLRDTCSDIVVGSRYIPGGGSKDWSFARLVMSRLACVLARPLTPVRDATSGFFLVRRPAIEGVTISAGGFKICLELLVRGRIRSVAEVPYVFAGRTLGQSKMNLREAVGYFVQLRDLLRVRRAKGALPPPSYRRISPDELRTNLGG